MAIPLKRLDGKYEILEKLHEGGMGAIYKVRHRLHGELRVIKRIRPQLVGDATLEARFLREAEVATRLDHPNLTRVYDYAVDEDGAGYLVMELIRGLTLGELLRAGQRLPVALALEIARQSLRAIGYLHAQGVVHRDVSPDNLMLTLDRAGRPLVKLIDLGLVKPLDDRTRQLTGAGMFVGKFRYAAPELFGESGTDPRRADFYSLAVVLYELLTGRYPIAGDGPASLIAGHLFRPPLDFASSDPGGRVPGGVRRAVLRGLEKSPDGRFEDAESFAEALASGPPCDLASPEVAAILGSIRADGLPRLVPVPQPGTTQARINLQFVAEPTPAPETSRLVVVPETPAPDAAAAERLPEALEVAGPTLVLRNLQAQVEQQLDRRAAGRPGREKARRERHRALLAEARRCAAAEDFEAARELLNRALDMIPGDPEALALRASVEACIEVRAAEACEAEEVERTLADIRTLLDTGRTSDALAELGHAEDRFGDYDELQTLHREAVRTRVLELQAQEDGQRTVILTTTPPPEEKSPVKEGDDRAARPGMSAGSEGFEKEVTQVTASIRRYQAEGRPGRALEELQSALQKYGLNETFQKLRWELGQAMLDRYAEEEDSASLRTVPAETGAGAGVPPAAAARVHSGPVDLPLGGVTRGPAAPHGFGPQPSFPNRHARRTGGRWLLMVGLVVVVAVSAAVLLSRLGLLQLPGAVDEPVPQVIEAVVPDPGFLALDAVPWAEILSIVPVGAEAPPPDRAAGEEVEVDAARFTPVVLELPPGTYRIRLRYPPAAGEQEIEVRVESGARSGRRVTFEELDGQRYFEKVGW